VVGVDGSRVACGCAASGVLDGAGARSATAGGNCGGLTLTAAACRTCDCTGSAAAATGSERANTFAGTTVAAPRFANCWFSTGGGGSTVCWLFTTAAMLVIFVALTLAMLMFSMYVGSRV
jgi:hypothetical protein